MKTATAKRVTSPASFKRSVKKTVIIEKKQKPAANTLLGSNRSSVAAFKRPVGTPTYAEVFGRVEAFSGYSRTVGEDVLILRAYMHLEGMPAIPEKIAVCHFANVFARFVMPRREWPFFDKENRAHVREAKAFIRKWSTNLLSKVVSGGEAKACPPLHSNMIPEMAAFYNPSHLGLGVA